MNLFKKIKNVTENTIQKIAGQNKSIALFKDYTQYVENQIIKEEWSSALKYCELALKIYPDVHVFNLKGIALLRLKRYTESEKCFEYVINRYRFFKDESLYFEGDDESYLKESYLAALTNYGILLLELGDPKDALRLHNYVLELDPLRSNIKENIAADIESLNKIEKKEDIKLASKLIKDKKEIKTNEYDGGLTLIGKFKHNSENKYFDGIGVVKYPNGIKYIGQFKDSCPIGKCTFILADNTKLNGTIKYNTPTSGIFVTSTGESCRFNIDKSGMDFDDFT